MTTIAIITSVLISLSLILVGRKMISRGKDNTGILIILLSIIQFSVLGFHVARTEREIKYLSSYPKTNPWDYDITPTDTTTYVLDYYDPWEEETAAPHQ